MHALWRIHVIRCNFLVRDCFYSRPLAYLIPLCLFYSSLVNFNMMNRYARTSSGLAPEYVEFASNGDLRDIAVGDSRYNLRPETVETMYILHHITGDPVYREWAWEIFQAIEAHCKAHAGYGSFGDVNDDGLDIPQDEMESFFLAETLKYLFLLFDPDTNFDLQTKV